MYYGQKLFPLFFDSQILATFGNGRLYNWYAASQANIAPEDCHVPTQAEFTTLRTFLGGASVAGGPLKSTRTGLAPGFNTPNTGATNDSKFNGLGSGYRFSNGLFFGLNIDLYLWSSTQFDASNAYDIIISRSNTILQLAADSKKIGQAIRFLLDNPATYYPGMTITDIDGNVYPMIQIGTQVWAMTNLKTTRYNDGTVIPFAGVNGINFSNAEWAALTTPGQCTYNNAAIAEYTELWPAA